MRAISESLPCVQVRQSRNLQRDRRIKFSLASTIPTKHQLENRQPRGVQSQKDRPMKRQLRVGPDFFPPIGRLGDGL